jgi:hypothetical protein
MGASTSAAPSTNKPGVEVHWQSETRTLADFAAHICLSELGADVFFQPLLKNGEVVDKPKVRIWSTANFRGLIK